MIAGGGMMVQMAASNTLVQTLVDEDKRGRVMSFYTMAFFGMMPFGSLAAGWLGGRIGAPWTVVAGGVATLMAVGCSRAGCRCCAKRRVRCSSGSASCPRSRSGCAAPPNK